MLDAKSVIGASGFVLGLPVDGNNLVKQVKFTYDKIPPCFISRHLGHSMRNGLLGCKPRVDHDGRRWEDMGLPYEELGHSYGIIFMGKVGNAFDQAEARKRLATRFGYNGVFFKPWNLSMPVNTIPAEPSFSGLVDGSSEPTLESNYRPTPLYDALTSAVRQITIFTRHTAGTTEHLSVFTAWMDLLERSND